MQQYALLLLNIFLRSFIALLLLAGTLSLSRLIFGQDLKEALRNDNKAAAGAILAVAILIGLIAAFTST